jgi:hypothetical protein
MPRRKLVRNDGSQLALVFEHALQALCDATPPDAALRNRFVVIINNLPIVSKALNALANGDARYPYVVAYERCRLGALNTAWDLEGIPKKVSITGHTIASIPHKTIDGLKFKPLHDLLINKLNMFENHTPKHPVSSVNLLDTLPAGLHWKMHVFISEMRALYNGIHTRRHSETVVCRNCACQRRFFPNRGSCQTKRDYFAAIASDCVTTPYADFCNSACYTQVVKELEMHTFTNEIYKDETIDKNGRQRVTAVFRAVQKRNELASRRLRNMDKNPRKLVSVAPPDIDKAIKMHVKRLNVDFALVMLADRAVDSLSLSRGRILAGTCSDWRSDLYLFASKLQALGKLYDKVHRDKHHIIYNVLLEERYLTRVRAAIKI